MAKATMRKVVQQGHSLTVTIPSQLASLAGLKAGDSVEWDFVGKSRLAIEKAEE